MWAAEKFVGFMIKIFEMVLVTLVLAERKVTPQPHIKEPGI
jgi:hypothetical protein